MSDFGDETVVGRNAGFREQGNAIHFREQAGECSLEMGARFGVAFEVLDEAGQSCHVCHRGAGFPHPGNQPDQGGNTFAQGFGCAEVVDELGRDRAAQYGLAPNWRRYPESRLSR